MFNSSYTYEINNAVVTPISTHLNVLSHDIDADGVKLIVEGIYVKCLHSVKNNIPHKN